jgi:hypothetical protein
MKRIKFLGIMMLGMSWMFQSCKDDLNQLQQENTTSGNSLAFENERKQKFATNAVDESIKGDFELKEGVLHFKNVASFMKLRDSFVNLHMPERAEFAEKQGFESRLSVTFGVLEKLRTQKSKVEFENLIESNADFVVFDEVSQTATSRISDDCLASIINKDGFVYIGKILYKFTDGTEYIVFDGDKSKLNGIKNGRIGESLEVSVMKTKNSQLYKNTRICNYWGVLGSSTNSNYTDRTGKVEYQVDGLSYFYEPNGNPATPWRVQGHSYVKASAQRPGFLWGGRTDYHTWHWLFVDFQLQLAQNGTVLGTTRVRTSKLEASMGADFHNYVDVYRGTNEPVSVVFNTNNPVIFPESPGENKYNWAEAGPNQWLNPNDCHDHSYQW